MEFQLKIGILGAGAMGILYGGLLKRSGHDVNLIVRDYNKKKLLVDKGICLNLDLGRFTVYPGILHIKDVLANLFLKESQVALSVKV